jgi:nicotinate phosphoribosyltransferase
VTLVDKKQIWRRFDDKGLMQGDTIALREETLPEGVPLLQPVMHHGAPIPPRPTLEESRDYFRRQYALLPEPYKAIEGPPQYPVRLSQRLEERETRVEEELHQRELGEA